MKIQQNNKSKKILLISSIAILAVILGIILYVGVFGQSFFGWPVKENQNQPTENSARFNTDPPSQNEINTGTDAKEETVENDKNADSNNTNSTPNLSVTLTASGETQTTYQLRYLIQGVVGSGTCSLQLSKDDLVINKSAPIQALANASTCQGFDIPLDELSSGQWEAKMIATNDSSHGSSTVTIHVKK